MPVGNLPVDADDDLVDARVNHRHGFLPAGGVLREHHAGAPPVDVVDGVAPRDLGDGADGCRRGLGRNTHGDGGGNGLRGVAKVGAAGQLEFESHGDVAWAVQEGTRTLGGQVDVRQPPVGLRATL